MRKIPYVCGPLTELPPEEAQKAKTFYECVADIVEGTLGVRAFVPHEHYDPVKHPNFDPTEVDAAERRQIRTRTSLLIVVALEPTWGGGIEVEMAHEYCVPAVILCERAKLENRKISRLLRGNPAVVRIIAFEDKMDALRQLAKALAATRAGKDYAKKKKEEKKAAAATA